MSAGFLLFLVVVLVMPGNKAALETEGVFHVLPRFLNEDGKRTIQREREREGKQPDPATTATQFHRSQFD